MAESFLSHQIFIGIYTLNYKKIIKKECMSLVYSYQLNFMMIDSFKMYIMLMLLEYLMKSLILLKENIYFY